MGVGAVCLCVCFGVGKNAPVCERVFVHPLAAQPHLALYSFVNVQGITVYRFANRIPLLFEAGADVVSRTAYSKIKCVTSWLFAELAGMGEQKLSFITLQAAGDSHACACGWCA